MTSRARKRKLEREAVKNAIKEQEASEARYKEAQAEIDQHLAVMAIQASLLSRARRGLRRR